MPSDCDRFIKCWKLSIEPEEFLAEALRSLMLPAPLDCG